MRRTRPLSALIVATVALLVLMEVGQVWALTITPASPIAGQSFTITNDSGSGEEVDVLTGSGCNSGNAVFISDVGSFQSVSVPGQPAGQYSASGTDEGCVNFTIIPAPIPEYPYGLLLLSVFMVVAYTLIRSKTKTAA